MAGIRTPDQRLRVFVSSTMEELAAERTSVQDSIRRLRLTPVLFELGARRAPRSSASSSRTISRICSASADAWQAGQALTRDQAAALAATA